ncbi:DUF998 domain-containing protein [Nocardia goodfellowii]|uniref:DUF998 domain-containing protein n=1 Tax=Nocardia goodfellowii TaxID=882446 RepID=A0ABS4QA67_9NOCA|nr:DUF998 domain-containing protein [Nocardia goodfellowii]MBP2188030.1 hypothetical protein [Nocardia goodfellowii]
MAFALVLAGLCYSSWVLEFVLPVHADPVNTFLSELDAEGKPYRWVFATGDKITAALLVPTALTGLWIFPRRRLSTLGWAALLCFGAATIADALFPLTDCDAPSCGDDRSALFPQLHQPHAMTSTLAVTSIAVAVLAFSLAAFRYRPHWRVLRELGLGFLLVGALATVWMLVADNLSGDYALGIAQRVQVAAMSLWLGTLGIAVLREARDDMLSA